MGADQMGLVPVAVQSEWSESYAVEEEGLG
jgi:hypothetical protein